ncbi:MAG TPA: hypothetical protein VE824_01355 [Gaiellales bacterium]|nr:hypothetical protein [Gaiellales bacterium]
MARTAPPPPADDLRRADDAQQQELPTADEVQERIGDVFGQTPPLN